MHRILCFLGFAVWLAACEKQGPAGRLPGFEVHGIDVSHYQNQIFWDSVQAADVQFAFVKATEGATFQDSFFCKNWDEMAKIGLKRGAYHFFRPKTDAIEQAWNFLNLVELRAGDLPPVLDVETTDGLPHDVFLERLRTWLWLVEKEGHARPIIYSNYNFYEKWLAGFFQNYPIWIARFDDEKPQLSFQKDWAFWQYGHTGRLAGVGGAVDFDVFLGKMSDLERLCLPDCLPECHDEICRPEAVAAVALPFASKKTVQPTASPKP